LIGLNSIVTSNRVAKIFLALQMAVIFVFLYICFANPQRSLGDIITNAEMLNEDGTGLTPVTFGAILMGIGILCAAIDGYPASLGFSEETKGSCRNVGKAVFISAATTAVIIVLVLIMSMIAAPNLFDFLSSSSPLLYTAESYMGTAGATIINVGIIISSFGCLVVIINYMARVLYTGARDKIWPGKMNDALTKVSGKGKVPWVATILIAAVDCILVFASDIVSLITFGGMAAATVYLLIAIGSINSRIKDKLAARPFKMPLFPLPSIIVIIFLVVAIVSQTPTDLAIVGGLLVIALIYYFAYIRPRDKKEQKNEQ
ncbi:MAG: APC family permease, partial [Anaerovoracaceae bacterium]